MRRLFSFIVVTLDGYYEGPNGEFDWPNVDDEFNQFAIEQINGLDALVFGRVGYEGMASYWPTPDALRDDPLVAGLMNGIPKYVVSTTLEAPSWQNTAAILGGNLVEEITALKAQPGKDLAIFGSIRLTTSLLELGLLDELRLMIHPVALGAGKSLFTALSGRLQFRLSRTTTFSSGNVMLHYEPLPRA